MGHFEPKTEPFAKTIRLYLVGEADKAAADTLQENKVYSVIATRKMRSCEFTTWFNTPLIEIKKYESSFGVTQADIKNARPYKKQLVSDHNCI